LTAFLEGIGLVISPSLPIICIPFKFLKSLDLTTVGLGLNEIPFDFRLKLVIWEPFGVQFGSKAVLRPNETGFDVVNVLDESSPWENDGDSDMASVEIGPEPISAVDDLETGPEPVPEAGESDVEPPPIFEEHEDLSFEKVADFEREEEVEPPVVILQPKTISLPQPSEGPRKKRIKTLAGRIDLPLIHQFLAMQAKATSSPSQTKSTKQKPSTKPTRKSFRIAVKSTQKSRKQGGSSK